MLPLLVMLPPGAVSQTLPPAPLELPEARMVPSWQGLGLGGGLVFVGLASAQVAALSQETGELVWASAAGSVPPQDGETVTTAPVYARGQVFVGVANGDSGGQGPGYPVLIIRIQVAGESGQPLT